MAIKEETIWVTINGGNVNQIESKGYFIPRVKTKWGKTTTPPNTKIEIKVCDLSDMSNAIVTKICDICGCEVPNQKYAKIIVNRRNVNSLDVCKNCSYIKRNETRKNKFPVEKSLEYRYPEIAKEWHPTKNGDIKPNQVYPSTNIMYWWICPNNIDHDYESVAISRTVGSTGCPYCCNMKINSTNCLATEHPNLLKIWDFEKNGEVTPYNTGSGQVKKVWWNCYDCGSDYDMSPINKTWHGQKCPYCTFVRINETNCLNKTHPNLIEEWNLNRNIGINSFDLTYRSDKKVWWICKDCSHEWKTSIIYRTEQGTNCPKCSGNLRRTQEEFIEKIFSLVGLEYTVLGTYINSVTNVLMKHNECGHEYPVLPSNFTKNNGNRCPLCFESIGERTIRGVLTVNNLIFIKQYRIDECRYKNPLPFDFAVFDNENNLQLLIEFDGSQHEKPVKFFGGEKAFKALVKRDAIKTNYCNVNNIPLIRISYRDIEHIEEVLTLELIKLNIDIAI